MWRKKKTPQEQHTAHTYSTIWSKNDTKHWKECSCGAKTEESNHSFGDWQEVEPATTTKEVLKEKNCSICSYKKQEKIPMVSPVYEWKSIDLLQPTMIVGGKSDVVLDEKGDKQNFTDLVDRQLDMLAQEIISRLEYVYGNTNENKTHTITDNLHNDSAFTTYKSINAMSEPLSSQPKYTVYNNKDVEEERLGYIMMRNGERVIYDETLHTHYITLNGTKYAAICSANTAGVFTSETALQATFEAQNQSTIDHVENSYDHEGILTLKGAIYGTPTWEYEEKQIGISNTYVFSYNINKKRDKWNWADYFENGTAKNELKKYLAYIISKNITSFSEIKNISTINYVEEINNIQPLYDYLTNYKEIIFQFISKEIIGEKSYNNDYIAGLVGETISYALYKSYIEFDTGHNTAYYDKGKFIQLYSSKFTESTLSYLNRKLNTNLNPDQFLQIRNYKAYDIVINGILNQISNQSAYLTCEPVSYETMSTTQKATVNTNDTNIYLFLKTTNSKDIRLDLGVPYATGITLTDKNGNNISYTKENVNGNLVLKLKGNTLPAISTTPTKTNVDKTHGYGATSTLEEVLGNRNYLHLTLSGVTSFTLTTEEYIQIN